MTQPKPIPEMNGTYASRKFILTILGLLLVSGVAVAGIWSAAIPTVLPTFVGGILGVLSLYFTGNIANKFVVGKQMVQMESAKSSQSDDQGGAA